MKMEANERLYGHGVVTCEWNGGNKGEIGLYFEYILEALHQDHGNSKLPTWIGWAQEGMKPGETRRCFGQTNATKT